MTLKEKTKTYSFWISLVSTVILVAKTIAEQLGYTISDTLTTNIITGVCAVMVLVGLFISPTKRKSLEELTADAEEIIKEQEQAIEQIKKEVESAMDEQEKLSIEKQIEYLKAKLAEDEQKQEEQIIVEETQPEESYSVEEKVEEEQVVQEEQEEKQEEEQDKKVDYHELGLAELKEILQELLNRI